MATFTGTNANETIIPGNVSGTVTASPVLSTPSGANDTINGGGGNDSIEAAGGNDTIEVKTNEAENDTRISGGTGSDTIKNTAGSNFRLSNLNNDTNDDGTAEFNGGTGTISGGIEKIDGNGKALLGNNAANYFDFAGVDLNVSKVDTEGGEDTVIGSDMDDRTYELGNGADTFTGTGSKKDRVLGESGNDIISTGGGNDTITGGGNNDDIDAGAGNDTINVKTNEAENDARIAGGTGSDTIKNTAGSDFRLSNVNNDTDGDGTAEFNVGTGTVSSGIEKIDGNSKVLLGNNAANHFDFAGVDLNVSKVDTEGGEDTVIGSDMDDRTYELGNGTDTFTGTGSKKDRVLGESGNDIISTGGGNDTITGGGNNDDIDAGAGNDTINVKTNEAENDARIAGGTGSDTIKNTAGSDFRLSNVNNDTDGDGTAEFNVGTGTVSSGIEKIDGNSKVLLGNNAANHFDFAGVDLNVSKVDTEGGEDTVIGSDMDDRTYELGNGTDTFTGTGSKKDRVLGESGNDIISTGAGNDTITGGGNNDHIDAGAGNDTINVKTNEAENDTRISGGTGSDTIKNTAGSDFRLSNVNNDTNDNGTANKNAGVGTVSGGIEKIDGNGKALLGNNGANYFNFDGVDLNVSKVDTEGGEDTVIGSDMDDRTYELGNGADTFTGSGSKKDKVFGESGNDSINGGGGNDTISGGNNNDLVAGGDGRDNVDGDSGDDLGRYFAKFFNDNDDYDGGTGNCDTFQVVLTTDQLGLTGNPALNPMLNEFKAYQEHLLDGKSNIDFTFETFGTTDPNTPDTADDVTVVN